MFRTLRYYSLTSLVTIVLAAVLLVVLYREVAIAGIVRLGEEKNVSLARTALNSLESDLIQYLNHSRTGKRAVGDKYTRELAAVLGKVMDDTGVVRVKVLDSRGIVAYSTKAEQIGDNENNNPGYESAIAGQVASKLIYRDGFNPWDRTTGDENLIQTYLPIREAEDKPIRGVFEVYTDVSHLVAQVERTQVQMVIGAILIMGLVYLALLFIVRRADRVMAAQRRTIVERTRALEMVSAQLFIGQEKERKRLAGDLHEGLAQSLAGIKMQLDAALETIPNTGGRKSLRPLNSAIGALQTVIDEVRSLAMGLHPPSLDDLGLVETLSWYLKQLQQAHPTVSISSSVEVDEADVPAHLKTSIYRVVEDVLGHMAREPSTIAVSVRLTRSRNELTLELGDSGQSYRPGGRPAPRDAVTTASAQERTLLSGGTFTQETTPWGATRITACWPLLEVSRQAQA